MAKDKKTADGAKAKVDKNFKNMENRKTNDILEKEKKVKHKSLFEKKEDNQAENTLDQTENAPEHSENTLEQIGAIIATDKVSQAFDDFIQEAMAIDYSTLDKAQLARLKKNFNDILKNLTTIATEVEKKHNELLMGILVLGDLFINTLKDHCEEMLSSMNKDELKSFAAKLYDYRTQINSIRDQIMTAADNAAKAKKAKN